MDRLRIRGEVVSADIDIHCPTSEDGLDAPIWRICSKVVSVRRPVSLEGGGIDGFNLDFELADGEPLDQWVEQLRAVSCSAGGRYGTTCDVLEPGWQPGMEWREVEVFGRDRRITEHNS